MHACDRAVRHMRGRRTAIVALVAAVAWQTVVGTFDAGWAALVLLAGSWGVHLVDRYLAQLRLNALLAGELQAPVAAEQAHALPYQYERRPTGDRHRFIGAGLQAWHEAVIGIDVSRPLRIRTPSTMPRRNRSRTLAHRRCAPEAPT